jgi:diguanylate cyclase (GGDEF)-like protein
LDLSSCADSPYAAELPRASPRLRFAPPIEAEYLRQRLLGSQRLIRVASIAALGLILLRGAEQIFAGLWNLSVGIAFAIIAVGSLVMALLAWSSWFERLYPRWAPLIVPVRNAIISAQVAVAVTHGQPEMLIVLPITFIGPFFFLGLPLRTSMLCCLTTGASYMICAGQLGLPGSLAVRSDLLLLGSAAACIVAVWNLEKTSRLSFLEGRLLAEMAQRDPLTGTRNRRVFDEHLERLWQHAIDNERSIALLLIDIDHFKAYNDHYGHQAGDQTLRRVAQAAQKFISRPLDILTRYGGEEFTAILYDVDADYAWRVAEQIRLAVSDMAIDHRASRSASKVTISVGVAAIQPRATRTPSGALQLADQALYEAKVQGRNRVELMDDTHHSLLVTGVFAINSNRIAS